MTHTQTQGADGAGTKTGEAKALSARTLAGMLRSRIERAAEHKSETVSLGQFFADQIHRYLTEAGNGPEHDARSGHVPADGGDPDCDRGRDWGLRARQVHLEALSKRAAGGEWFASTNGADGLARLDNGTDGMFPVRGEWHEIEFIEALVNAYRNGDLAAPAATPGVPDSVRALSEDARDLLNSVLDWLRGVCPCGNVGPAQCPVCGARIDDPTGFCAMSHRRRFPDHLLGRIEQALGISVQPAGQDDPERCIACGQPLKSGERVLSDASGGRIHAACCGPERESYTGADGEPLGPNDPIPHGYVYEGEEPAGQSTGLGADAAAWKERLERAFYDSGGFYGQMVEYAARTALPVVLAAIKPAPDSTRTGAAETEATARAMALSRDLDWAEMPDIADLSWQPASAGKAYWRELAALAARPEAPSDAGWRSQAADEIDAIADLWSGDGRSYAKTIAAILRAEEPEQLPPADAETKRQVQRAWDRFKVGTSTPPSDPAPSGQAEG